MATATRQAKRSHEGQAARRRWFYDGLADPSIDLLHVQRVLPDYTWWQRLPTAEVRRLIVDQTHAAAALTRQVFPNWDV